MDKEDPFYDMLLNLKTQVDYNLFIHPIMYCLCQIKPNGLVDMVAPINNNSLEDGKILCMLKKVPEEDVLVVNDSKKKLKEI